MVGTKEYPVLTWPICFMHPQDLDKAVVRTVGCVDVNIRVPLPEFGCNRPLALDIYRPSAIFEVALLKSSS